MKNKKRKIFIDFRENFQKKTKLIEDLRILISNELNLKEKEDIFNSIRRKWITIGKVPSHLAFNLNNSYDHQVKLYYDLVYLNSDYKEKDLDKIYEYANEAFKIDPSSEQVSKTLFLAAIRLKNFKKALELSENTLLKNLFPDNHLSIILSELNFLEGLNLSLIHI